MIERESLVERSRRMGELLLELTLPLVERHEVVSDVRGRGLMWAIEFDEPRSRGRRAMFKAIERAQAGIFSQLVTVPLFHEHRILVQVAGHRMNVIKALPALVVEEEEIRRFADALEEVVGAAEKIPRAMAGLSLRGARGAVRSI